MKITRIETIPIRVPLKAEFAIRSGRGGAHTVSPFLLVKVHTDAGLTGLGEASCTPRWSGEDQVTGAHLIRAYLEPLLKSEDPRRVEDLARKFRLAFAGNFFTKAAVEMALWDLAGKAAGKPVYEMLGGKARQSVPTKWSISGREPDEAAEIAAWAAGQGFKKMKIKVGLDPDGDVSRAAAVRERVGRTIEFGVDANGGWSAENAAPIIERLYAHEISFVEQPLPPEEIEATIQLRRGLRVPLIADESVCTLQDARELALLKAADVFSVYVGKAGGIGPARQIAEFAEARGIQCTLGSNLELGVGSAAMVHLATAVHNVAAEAFPCDIIGPFYYEDDVVKTTTAISPGKAQAADLPGLGVELDDEKVERYRVR